MFGFYEIDAQATLQKFNTYFFSNRHQTNSSKEVNLGTENGSPVPLGTGSRRGLILRTTDMGQITVHTTSFSLTEY